jgi:polyisoprenoid-binding protein YceI
MNRGFALFLGAMIFCASPSRGATETTWRVDPGHSNAEFSVRHLVITNVKGTIPIEQAAITTAPGSTLPISITATLDPSKLNTGNSDRDADLRGKDFFDVVNSPTITFAGTKISGTSEAFTVVGNLTIRGITKSVTLAAKALGTTTDGRGRVHAAYEATTTVDRRDFGMTTLSQSGGALIAGTDVSITLEIEAVAAAG